MPSTAPSTASSASSSRQPGSGSCYARLDAAHEAIAAALPSIEQMLRLPSVCGLGVLALVLMDPASSPLDSDFESAVLLEHAVGPRERWDVDYMAFARAKARLSWQHRVDSARVPALSPQLLRQGDSLLDGGVWLDGIVVAASGAMPWYDEAFALCVAAHLRAVAKRLRAETRGAWAGA